MCLPALQVDGVQYSLLECVYLRPWPNAEPWIARIEEILTQLGRTNKVENVFAVRWFYRRRDLLPSGEAEFPACEDEEREVYYYSGRPDEVKCKTVLGKCSVVASTDVPDVAEFVKGNDCYFYRYEYNPYQRDKTLPLFTMPGGKPIDAPSGGVVSSEASAAAAASAASVAPAAPAPPAVTTSAPTPAPAPRPAKRPKQERAPSVGAGGYRPGLGCVMMAASASSSSSSSAGSSHITSCSGSGGGGGSSGGGGGYGAKQPKPSSRARSPAMARAASSPSAARSSASAGSASAAGVASASSVEAGTAAGAVAAGPNAGLVAAATCSAAAAPASPLVLVKSDDDDARGGASSCGSSGVVGAASASTASAGGATTGGATGGDGGGATGGGEAMEVSAPDAPDAPLHHQQAVNGAPPPPPPPAPPPPPPPPPARSLVKTEASEAASAGPAPSPLLGRRRTREERLALLQAKLDTLYPPFTSVSGTWQRELEAVIPLPGERYAGEGCARCLVQGCERFGLLFHFKNLMTHAAPRGGQPSRVAGNRQHSISLQALLGYVPNPPPMPTTDPTARAPAKKKLEQQQQQQQQQQGGGGEGGGGKGTGGEGEGETSAAVSAETSERASAFAAAAAAAAAASAAAAAASATARAMWSEKNVDLPIAAEPVRTAGPSSLSAGGGHHARRAPREEVGCRNHEASRNYHGNQGRFIKYRNMKLPFNNGQVLLVRRETLGLNPARNVKFLGNLKGERAEWDGALAAAKERAAAEGLVLSLFRQYDEMHVMKAGGLDSNHCLHLFNHYKPKVPPSPRPPTSDPPARQPVTLAPNENAAPDS